MGYCREGLFIAETRTEIETACEQIPKTRGVDGGIICTGFIDVEKVLKKVKLQCGVPTTSHFFLEKKLPFQVVFIAFADDDDPYSSGSFSSGCESGSYDERDRSGATGCYEESGASEGSSGSDGSGSGCEES